MKALLPDNEQQRVEALKRYKILDTSPEPAFDDIAALASLICQTPIALITLVDSEREWFKAKIGFPFSETKRDFAFCAHAILEANDLLIVTDAWADRHFADNPLATAAELELKNLELERVNRLFVGRELRMRELKQRIEELEKRGEAP